MSQVELFPDTTAEESQASPHSLTLLIEVPAINPLPITRAHAPLRTMRTTTRQPHRCRRRLRRQVRLAGCTLLALVPMASACTLGWSNRPDRIVACAISDPMQGELSTDAAASPGRTAPDFQTQTGPATVAPAGVVVLSSDSPVAPAGTAAEPTVILPGYILPDDTREDLLHEGS
jgi:hypothetical protein